MHLRYLYFLLNYCSSSTVFQNPLDYLHSIFDSVVSKFDQFTKKNNLLAFLMY